MSFAKFDQVRTKNEEVLAKNVAGTFISGQGYVAHYRQCRIS